MKHPILKTISISLCAALASAGVTTAIFAAKTSDSAKETTTKTATVQTTASESESPLKDETVYVLAGADGSVQKIIVSDWLKNSLSENSLTDQSELSGITNSKGDESYSSGSDNSIVWDAQGNDIYYQGEISKELPVNLKVSYQLDGKDISAADLAGKSGKVTIRFSYENNLYEKVKINGKEETLAVPFAMLTGLMLDNDSFRNVSVSNGRLINDGDRTIVIGLALPGLQQNLNLDESILSLPDSVEITADVENFSLGITVTVATNEVFSELDTDNLDSLDELSDSIEQLSDGMTQLLDGSSALYDGLSTLLDKSETLVDGINQLAEGAAALKSGAADLSTGASSLQSGVSSLYTGLSTLSENNDSLNGGAKQVFETLLATANSQIKASGLTAKTLTIENYASVLDQLISALDETSVYNQALQQVTAAVEANQATIEQKVTEAVKEQVTAKVTVAVEQTVTTQVQQAVTQKVTEQVIQTATKGTMTAETYQAAVQAGQIDEATQAQIQTAIDTQLQSDAVKQQITDAAKAQMQSDTVTATIAQQTAAQMQSDTVKETIEQQVALQKEQLIAQNMASDTVQQKLTAASEGAKSLIALKSSLDSYNSFYLGLQQYTAGVSTAKDGAAALQDGSKQLSDGASALQTGIDSLYDGILQLKDGAPALIDGVTQLKDGAMSLSEGLQQFNEQGVQKLVDAADGDLSALRQRIQATVQLSKDYQSFAGCSDTMDGQVKFIYRTEAIESEN